MAVKIAVRKNSNMVRFRKQLQQVGKRAVYVGIPASSAQARSEALLAMAEKIVSAANARGKKATKRQSKRYTRLVAMAKQDVNNAELLFIFSKGSPLRNQPARPVIEPAIVAQGNKEPIAAELAAATKSTLDGKSAEAVQHLKRAGMAGQNAARDWFTDSRNGWAPNAPHTIRAKGSDRPGIDTAQMRQALTYVLRDDS